MRFSFAQCPHAWHVLDVLRGSTKCNGTPARVALYERKERSCPKAQEAWRLRCECLDNPPRYGTLSMLSFLCPFYYIAVGTKYLIMSAVNVGKDIVIVPLKIGKVLTLLRTATIYMINLESAFIGIVPTSCALSTKGIKQLVSHTFTLLALYLNFGAPISTRRRRRPS